MIFSKEELPMAQFSLLGINWQDAAQMPPSEMFLLLQGRRTALLCCMPILPGESQNRSLRARLSLSRDSEGKAILQFHPRALEQENSFGLNPAQIQELKAHPETPLLVVEEGQLWSVYLDPQSNEMLGLNFDALRAPMAINGQALTEEQEMRFKLGETISFVNSNGTETVFRLDPFQPSGIIGRNLDSVDIGQDASALTIPYKGRILVDNEHLLQQDLGGLLLIEEALKQRLLESSPDLLFELDRALVGAKEEILQYKASHAGQFSSDEIAGILSRHLYQAGIPFSASLEPFLASETTSLENDLSDLPVEDGNEKIHWLASSKNIDGAGIMMLESAIGATVIGLLSAEEKERLAIAFQKAQVSMGAGKEVLNPIKLQSRLLELLRDQLGPRLTIYQKDSQQKVSQTAPSPKQQPNISQ